MEANRVMHLASMHSQAVQSMVEGQKTARKDALLRMLLESRAFALAEQLSRLHGQRRAGILEERDPPAAQADPRP